MNTRQHSVVSPLYYSPHHPPPLYHDPALASLLAQRPLHLPLGGLPAAEHHHHQHHLQQQQQQHNQQLSLAAAGAYQHPNFRPSQQQFSLRQRHPLRQARATMAFPQQQPQGMSEEEMAELQKASNEYQPDATVSSRRRRIVVVFTLKCKRRIKEIIELAQRLTRSSTGAVGGRTPTEHGNHDRIRRCRSGFAGQDRGMF